jgi:hypothetical protein
MVPRDTHVGDKLQVNTGCDMDVGQDNGYGWRKDKGDWDRHKDGVGMTRNVHLRWWLQDCLPHKNWTGAGGVVQVVVHMPSKPKVRSSNPTSVKKEFIQLYICMCFILQ